MRQQPEDHREDLRAEAAVAQIREIVGKAENCFFCTTGTAEQTRRRTNRWYRLQPLLLRQARRRGKLS